MKGSGEPCTKSALVVGKFLNVESRVHSDTSWESLKNFVFLLTSVFCYVSFPKTDERL